MRVNSNVLVAAAGLALLLATGCSKSSDSSTASDSTSPSASAAPAGGESSNGAMSAAAPAAAASAGSSMQTVASAGDPAHGAAIFGANCASCHGANGVGGGIGPALKGEKVRKNTSAAIAWIKNPQPPMPKLYPSPLSDKDVADVAAYVESL
jgi:mono/diheme cytochrome c family protein